MPVLDTGIQVAATHVVFPMTFMRKHVDGRIKSGHDEGGSIMNLSSPRPPQRKRG